MSSDISESGISPQLSNFSREYYERTSERKRISPRQTNRSKTLLTRGRSNTKKQIIVSKELSPEEVYNKVRKIVENTKLNITEKNFINSNSKFMVITYWWGRGNINYNTQIPCKNLHHRKYHWILKDGQKLQQDPVYFEKMIDNWQNICIKSNCNFFSQEYPEFAKPGGYQLAINAKPLFIKKVLDTLTEIGRDDIAVVYIDGDMTVNKYPHIFDIENVDFMCRGWNMDPRGGGDYIDYPLFDPYTFETSGGIMYFANNIYAKEILDLWSKWSSLKKFEGKADDRILSMLINSKRLYVDYNILQLPIEYLWLTSAYEPKKGGYISNKHFNRKNILIEHPACLTLEEVAREQGAAANRDPPYYYDLVNKYQKEQNEGGLLFEFIIFDNIKQANEFKTYLDYISTVSYENKDGEKMYPYNIIKYKNLFGKLTQYFIDNTENIKTIINQIKNYDLDKYDNIVIEHSNNFNFNKNKLLLNDFKLITSYIIAFLTLKKNIIYIPKNTNSLEILNTINKKYKKYEFISNIYNDEIELPQISNNNPMFFSYNSTKLIKLLRISETIDDFIQIFKKSVLHIQLIRCLFIYNYNSSKNKSNKRLSLSYSNRKLLSVSDIETFKSLDNNNTISITDFKKITTI